MVWIQNFSLVLTVQGLSSEADSNRMENDVVKVFFIETGFTAFNGHSLACKAFRKLLRLIHGFPKTVFSNENLSFGNRSVFGGQFSHYTLHMMAEVH